MHITYLVQTSLDACIHIARSVCIADIVQLVFYFPDLRLCP